jgi:hypothetical protein
LVVESVVITGDLLGLLLQPNKNETSNMNMNNLIQ